MSQWDSVALENDNNTAEAAKAAAEADRVSYLVPGVKQETRDLRRGRLLAAKRRFDESLAPCRKWIAILEVPNGPESDRRLMLPLEEFRDYFNRPGVVSKPRKSVHG